MGDFRRTGCWRRERHRKWRARTLDPLRFHPRDASLDQDDPPRGDHPGAGFVYVFTSGTTGPSKVLLASHFEMAEKSRAVAALFGLDANDRVLRMVSWPSWVGLRTIFRAHFAGAAFVNAPIDETRALTGETLARFGITRMHATPWHLRRLLQSPPPPQPWPPLRSINMTGAMISAAEVIAVRAELSLNLYVECGSSQLSYVSQLRPGAAPTEGCVGTLVPGVEARVDDAQGRALPTGQVGELGFRCAWMSTG
ncbi:MAG: hypothetical protein JWN73_1151 [Betaproteobacteria bacterium]|nr:hypothetical protein [Betaproteobacteria bacterium]